MMIKDVLKRDVLVDKLEKYLSNNKNEYDTYFEKYIDIIENEFLNSAFTNDPDFLIKGRRKFLVDEIYNVLKNNDDYNRKHHIDKPFLFVLANIHEILLGNNMVYAEDVDKEKWEILEDGTHRIDGKYWQEIRDINERYNQNKIICLEEKQLIEELIEALKLSIKKNQDVKNFMIEFINEESEQLTDEDIEFIEYSKKFKERFGREPYIAEPNGTMEKTIKAIKTCLKKDKDILDQLLYPNRYGKNVKF